jgi:lichenan operon transcriptional antiterminator
MKGICCFCFYKHHTRKNEISRKNILLVCASGHGSAELLHYKYQQVFGKYLDRIETCDIHHLEQMDVTEFDYIFTTVPIDFPVPIPIQEVRIFLEEKDIRKVRNVLNPGKNSRISNYYDEKLFLPNLWAESREQVLKVMCEHMIHTVGLPEEFYDSVVKRENLAKTDFGNLIALPHSYEAMSDRTFVCVAVLDRPVLWCEEEVQVVFLLSIEKQKNRELQHFFRVTMQYLMDTAEIGRLIHNRNFGFFLEAMNRIEKEILQEDGNNE